MTKCCCCYDALREHKRVSKIRKNVIPKKVLEIKLKYYNDKILIFMETCSKNLHNNAARPLLRIRYNGGDAG